jgi:hypothetical protein
MDRQVLQRMDSYHQILFSNATLKSYYVTIMASICNEKQAEERKKDAFSFPGIPKSAFKLIFTSIFEAFFAILF